MQQTSESYRDRRIDVRAPDGAAAQPAGDVEVFIDDEPIPYGRLVDGEYFLHENAYDWGDDLGELARRLVDHRERAAEVRRRRDAGAGE
jgi:hypothetical protein